MSWQIHSLSSTLEFAVNGYGLSISGTGEHYYQASANTSLDMYALDSLSAEWSIYKAADAFEAAGLISLDVSDMRRYLDFSVVKNTAASVCVIKKDDNCVGFSAFLTEKEFRNVWSLVSLVGITSSFKYVLNFEFLGFMPKDVEGERAISYERWLRGKPYLCKHGGFSIRAQQAVQADRNEAGGGLT